MQWGIDEDSIEIVAANMIRYRGYYFDLETGFYYLNSRYYDPNIRRFVSADDISYLGANDDMSAFNLYAYCSNNPVMYVDPMGNSLWDAIKNFIPNLLKSIEVELGVGLGIGFGGFTSGTAKASAEVYRDVTFFIDDGEFIVGNVVSAEASILSLGIGGKHIQYTDGTDDVCLGHYLGKNIIDSSMQIVECERNCKHYNSFSLTLTDKKSGTPINFDSNGVVGIGSSLHLGLGGHSFAGFNFRELYLRIKEDYLK